MVDKETRGALFFALLIRGVVGTPVIIVSRKREVELRMFGHRFAFQGEDRWARCITSLRESWKILVETVMQN